MKNIETVIVNNVEINCPFHKGQFYVPIRSVCQAIGVDYSSQMKEVKSNGILSSVVVPVTTTGADSKSYKMTCIPVEFVYGWIFSISEKRVAESAREALIQYKLEAYKALYAHFNHRDRHANQLIRRKAEKEARARDLRNQLAKEDPRFVELQELDRECSSIGRALGKVNSDAVEHQVKLFSDEQS